ncbi:MAG: hypothetical protein AAGN35_25515 [Bacteroidota bacterium]
MGKLYELLAVEQDRKNKANQVINRTKDTFAKKAPFFDGMIKRYVSLEEGTGQIPDEHKEMVTTVKDELGKAAKDITVALDAQLSKEQTNASNTAIAKLVVDGQSFGTFSATALLALESHLARVREMYLAIPTLDPARKWEYDEQRGAYKTDAEVKFRSVKRPRVIVKYEATKEHPAQTELMYLDEQVGKYESTYISGRLTPTQRRTLVERLDQLVDAVKIARTQANDVKALDIKVGEQLFAFVHQDIL